jgi:hypothetical protein
VGWTNQLIISHSRQFIFIHIHKTAGESIMASLRPDLAANVIRLRPGEARGIIVDSDDQPGLQGSQQHVHLDALKKHSTALEVRDQLTEETWDRYFTFSFVRHPIDRALSLYSWAAKAAQQPRRSLPQRVLGRFSPPVKQDPSQWNSVRAYRGTSSFSEFIRHPALDDAPGMRPQSASLGDGEGNLIVDFVGRFERINEDFRYVQEKLGLPLRPLRWKNRSRSRDDTTRHLDLSPEDRSYLAAKYQADFSQFGYEP